MRIAFAGNPNSGKTTMYNALTGRSERVGNWAGVTVEKKEGAIKKIYCPDGLRSASHSSRDGLQGANRPCRIPRDDWLYTYVPWPGTAHKPCAHRLR